MTRRYEIAQPGDDDCPTCGEPNLSWPKCDNCHTVDAAYLADRVKESWTVRVKDLGDDRFGLEEAA